MLLPGEAHPHPAMSPGDLAAHLAVSKDTVELWLAQGLPMDFGLIDPFTAANWIAAHVLHQAPALERRWKRLLAWFRPFVKGSDEPWTVRVRRAHRVHLDADDAARTTAINWWLPRLPTWDGQIVTGDLIPGAEQRGAHWFVETDLPALAGSAQVTLRPIPHTGSVDEFLPLVEDLVMESHYGYRHHLPDDTFEDRPERSCLDLALRLGDKIARRNRPWRLCAGVIAFDEVANPHFWIEVETTTGWAPIDPTPAALSRQFSQGDDWRDWARAWCGGCDARRVTVARGESPVRDVPGGPTLGSVAGEVAVLMRNRSATTSAVRKVQPHPGPVAPEGHRWINAWACTDWSCGSCTWSFRS